MCWLALVAEMLLLEVGHSKERRVSVDVKAGLLQLLRVVLQRSEVRVSLNTSTCPGVPCKASMKPASACRELPCASRGPLGISGGEKTGSSPTASDRGCLNNSFGIRSQGWCVYTRWCRAFSQAKQHDQTCSGCRAQGWTGDFSAPALRSEAWGSLYESPGDGLSCKASIMIKLASGC